MDVELDMTWLAEVQETLTLDVERATAALRTCSDPHDFADALLGVITAAEAALGSWDTARTGNW
jgi:hypothetical protein